MGNIAEAMNRITTEQFDAFLRKLDVLLSGTSDHPAGLEAVVMAIAGESPQFHSDNVVTALDRIAEQLEELTDAVQAVHRAIRES